MHMPPHICNSWRQTYAHRTCLPVRATAQTGARVCIKVSPRSMTVRVLYYLRSALVGRSRLACLALVSGRRRLARRRSFVWRRLESSTSYVY